LASGPRARKQSTAELERVGRDVRDAFVEVAHCNLASRSTTVSTLEQTDSHADSRYREHRVRQRFLHRQTTVLIVMEVASARLPTNASRTSRPTRSKSAVLCFAVRAGQLSTGEMIVSVRADQDDQRQCERPGKVSAAVQAMAGS